MTRINTNKNSNKLVKRSKPSVISFDNNVNESLKNETKEKNKKKISPKKIIINGLSLIFFIVFAYAAYKLIIRRIGLNQNEKLKEQTNEAVQIIEEKKIDKETNEEIVEQKLFVNFDKLKEINPDTVAYLKIKNTNIEYVVVKSDDNDYYLEHDFSGNYNTAGWIFADYKNKFDGTDKNIVVYGHSMKDGSMFGSLYKIFGSEWMSNSDNYDLIFYTPGEESIYRIFSMYRIEAEDYYITTDFSNVSFNEFISTIRRRSSVDMDVDVSENDQILTLSTCTTDLNKRIVIHAKKISQE